LRKFEGNNFLQVTSFWELEHLAPLLLPARQHQDDVITRRRRSQAPCYYCTTPLQPHSSRR